MQCNPEVRFGSSCHSGTSLCCNIRVCTISIAVPTIPSLKFKSIKVYFFSLTIKQMIPGLPERAASTEDTGGPCSISVLFHASPAGVYYPSWESCEFLVEGLA